MPKQNLFEQVDANFIHLFFFVELPLGWLSVCWLLIVTNLYLFEQILVLFGDLFVVEVLVFVS